MNKLRWKKTIKSNYLCKMEIESYQWIENSLSACFAGFLR